MAVVLEAVGSCQAARQGRWKMEEGGGVREGGDGTALAHETGKYWYWVL